MDVDNNQFTHIVWIFYFKLSIFVISVSIFANLIHSSILNFILESVVLSNTDLRFIGESRNFSIDDIIPWYDTTT